MLAAKEPPTSASTQLTMVVMDPLAAPLSCPCVQGYAQRDYDKLAEYLTAKLKRKVVVAYSDSLTAALKTKTEGKADIVIGKRSVVEFDVRANKLNFAAIAALTGKEGTTTQTGMIVVPSGDPAKSVADLKGYRIIFGPQECDEKHAAIFTLLKKNGVSIPAKLETSAACDEGATMILKAGKAARGAAVISSYAKPLLEGCGTVKKGDLRVLGETEPVPFITAYASKSLANAEVNLITAALLDLVDEPALLKALETQLGFVEIEKPKADPAGKKK